MNLRECLDVLKLEEITSMSSVKKAYRQQLLSLHPDRNNLTSSHDFMRIKEAYYTILSTYSYHFIETNIHQKELFKSRAEYEFTYKSKVKRLIHQDKISKLKSKKQLNLLYFTLTILLILSIVTLYF